MKQALYYEPFDRFTNGGVPVPSVNTVISRPGIGRTKWTLERAFYASKVGVNTLFITLESSIQDTIERLFEIVGKEELATHPMTSLHILEADRATVEDVKIMIANNVKTNGIRLVWIDSLDYLLPEEGPFMQEESDYIQATEALNELATQLNIAIVFTRQLNRKLEMREDKRPLLDDIGSKPLQNACHTVISLYRDELYHPETKTPNTTEVGILKQGDNLSTYHFDEVFLKKQQI